VLEANEFDRVVLGRSRQEPAGGPMLVVDDSLPVRIAFSKYIEQLGVRAVTAAAADEALEVVRAGVSAVISDYLMFGGSGLDLLRNVRRLDPEIPFLLTSTLFPAGVREAAYEAGASIVIDKLALVDELPDLLTRYGLYS
jgi:two-component system C4-dicarboxylate transport response regulator DctD